MFFRGSRYEAVKTVEYERDDGRRIRHKGIRFIPETAGHVPYTVNEGDRLDLISYKFFKDPEQFWRIADANREMHPRELEEEPGRRLVIPMDLE